jgi:hypothetical protein
LINTSIVKGSFLNVGLFKGISFFHVSGVIIAELAISDHG